MTYGSGLWGAINIHACTGENTQASTDTHQTHSKGSAVMAAWFILVDLLLGGISLKSTWILNLSQIQQER